VLIENMAILISDIVPFSRARTELSELVKAVENGAQKLITKNGEPAVAMISAKQLDHYHRLERAHIHLLLLGDVAQGLSDIAAGRTTDARTGLAALQSKRAPSAGSDV
jgi:prevent-host-death family protein